MTIAYESGELKFRKGEERTKEAVLALPLSRLLVTIVHKEEEAESALKAMNPFPDEPLTVSCEKVDEGIFIAAGLPESSAEDLGVALDGAGINVTRVDSLTFGEIRTLWAQISGTEVPVPEQSRKLVIIRGPECISLIVLDNGNPIAIRAVLDDEDLPREKMLVLLQAEEFAGAKEYTEVDLPAPDIDDSLAAIADRNLEGGTLNALPASWAEMLNETRFKRKLTIHLGIAGFIWAVIMAVLIGVPIVFGFMTDYQKQLCRDHRREFNAVSTTRDKVKLIRKYSDHSRGALEIMKAVSDRLPQGIDLTNWYFKHDDGVTVSGEATSEDAVYKFKDKLAEMAEEDGGEPIFPTVDLKGPTSIKNGKFKFDLSCSYKREGENE